MHAQPDKQAQPEYPQPGYVQPGSSAVRSTPGVPLPFVTAPFPGASPGQEGRRDSSRPLPNPVATPGPVAMRLVPVPDSAPPFEAPSCEAAPAEAGWRVSGSLRSPANRTRHAAALPGTGAPPGTGAAGPVPVRASATGQPPEPTAARPGGSAPRPAGQGPDWPSRFAQVLAETLAGARPPAQLTPWTTERARTQIRRLGPLLTARQRPVVQRIVTSLPTAGVVEMAVVVGCGPRVRGLAVRLEHQPPVPPQSGPRRWLCTAVEAA